MANPKNATPVGQMPNLEGFVREEVGFAPYWNPEAGAKVYATIEQMDQADPEFPRFLLRALAPVDAKRGSEEKGTEEDVKVEAGEVFSMSVYAQLAPKFAEYLSYPFPVPVVIVAKDKVKGGKGSVWLFDLLVSPETKAQLKSIRAARQLEANSANGAQLRS
jgi:hypothetical protein